MIAVAEVCNYGDTCRPHLMTALAVMISLAIIFAGITGAIVGASTTKWTDAYLRMCVIVAAVLVVLVITGGIGAWIYHAAWIDYQRSIR